MLKVSGRTPIKNKELIKQSFAQFALQGNRPYHEVCSTNNHFFCSPNKPQNFGFKIGTEFLQLQPREVALLDLLFKDKSGHGATVGGTRRTKEAASWTLEDLPRNGAKFFKPAREKARIHVLCVDNADSKVDEKFFRGKFSPAKAQLSKHGIEIHDLTYSKPVFPTRNSRTRRADFANCLSVALKANERANLVIIVIMSKNQDDYANIKWWGDC